MGDSSVVGHLSHVEYYLYFFWPKLGKGQGVTRLTALERLCEVCCNCEVMVY